MERGSSALRGLGTDRAASEAAAPDAPTDRSELQDRSDGGEVGGARSVHLVPHSHWDREWYEPFQIFRSRLVVLMDDLLDMMEADRRVCFTLDGQTAMIDDYLAMRPASRERVEALVRAGRLAAGPWHILMDEFLVSGETIVRNLELGWTTASRLGGVMPIGYLPDMFGHVSQMPQILRRAGLRDAVVWRGVPNVIKEHAFDWSAPDGSSVRAEYLPGGYGNAAYVLLPPSNVALNLARFVEAMEPWYGPGPVLAMHGTDHAMPSPELADLIGVADAEQDAFDIVIETLPVALEALAMHKHDGHARPGWAGELRSSARANMLVSVTSARIDLKAAAALAERGLERYAEPLAAMFGTVWPAVPLALAWRKVIENSAHDSICGCSADEVVDQVLVRYAEARQIATSLTEAACRNVADLVPRGWHAVVNPSPTPRWSLVELEAEGVGDGALGVELPDGKVVSAQEIVTKRRPLPSFETNSHLVRQMFGRRLHGREIFGHSLDGVELELDVSSQTHRLTLVLDDSGIDHDPDIEGLIDGVVARVQQAPEATLEVVSRVRGRRQAIAAVPVPPLGWTAARLVEVQPDLLRDPGHASVIVTDRRLSNGLIDIEVADDGTFSARGLGMTLAGVGRIVDGGDFGDSYDYAPPAVDRIVDRPASVEIRITEHGPLRAGLAIVRRYRWPEAVRHDGSARSDSELPVEVTTSLVLQVDEPFLRVHVEFDNPSRDHRVRWHVPLTQGTTISAAEGQFAVVERGLVPEVGHGEAPLATAPAHGFVHAHGVTVLLDHVTEYELVDGQELAITLLRSIGLISRNDNPNREEPAGPEVAIPGAQMVGAASMRFAIMPHSGSWSEADVLAAREAFAHPFVVVPGTSHSADARSAVGLRLEGTGVTLSSVRQRDGWLEVRVVAEHPGPVEATLRGLFDEAREADLLGRPGRALALGGPGSLHLPLGAWEIRTVQVRQADEASGSI